MNAYTLLCEGAETQLAKEFIRKALSTGQLSGDDRYDAYQIRLVGDSDEGIQSWLWNAVGGDEEFLDRVYDEVERVVASREDTRTAKRAKKAGSDPLGHLASQMQGLSFDQAVRLMVYRDPESHEHPDPFTAEEIDRWWKIVWKAAHGGGMGEGHEWDKYPRLSDVDVQKHDSLQRLFGHKVTRVPDVVTIYRGAPRAGAKLAPGNYTTTNRRMAQGYAGGKLGGVATDKIPSRDLRAFVLDNGDNTELIYWPDERGVGSTEPTESFEDFYKRNAGSVSEAQQLIEAATQYAYHVTLGQFLPSIAKNGLVPREHASTGEPVIFVEPDEAEAAIYADPPKTVMLRFPVDGFGTTDDGENIWHDTVPPQEIEVRQGDQWVQLV